ncbi:MAG: tetratricopeptide repeat protein [Bryobacteraceae bacterium]
MRRPFMLLFCVASMVVESAMSAQTSNTKSSAGCENPNQIAVRYVKEGHSHKAESLLLQDLSELGTTGSGTECLGLVLNNVAAIMLFSGRLAEAEIFAERSVKILEKSYSPQDSVLLRPLQILSAARFEQGKTGKAREAFQKMQAVPTERPDYEALVHGLAAALLQAEGRYKEAESEYLLTMSAWQRAGRANTADCAAVLSQLGSLFVEEHRFAEAERLLDRALAIFTADKDTVAMDRIKLLNLRAGLHARQGQWRKAGQDLREGVLIIDREPHVDPVTVAALLANYAVALRKTHQKGEARSVEARARALRAPAVRKALVDVTELFAESNRRKQ